VRRARTWEMPVSGSVRRRLRPISFPVHGAALASATVPRLARHVIRVSLVIAIVLIGLGAWLWSQAGSSTPVSEQAAGREYGSDSVPAVAGAPRSGVWTYRASGDEAVGIGPVTIDRRLPSEAQIVVRPAPKGFWRTLVLSEEHVEASRLRITPAGERLEERVTSVKVTGLGRDDRERLKPPPLVYPAAMEPSDAWTERYMMDEVRVVTRARVLGAQVLDVDGTQVRVLVIDKRGTVTGPIAGERNDRVWWSPDLRMPVRWVMHTELDGFASLRTDVDLVLTRLAPTS